MKLDKPTTIDLYYAALLHDIGLFVNTLRSWRSVFTYHTYFTNLILNKVSGLETVAQWASFHHERLDGSGYPLSTQ